jgi:hypothetical protein
MFDATFTPHERELFRKSNDTRRAMFAYHLMTHLQVEAQALKTSVDWHANSHDYMLAQIAVVEAIHDAVLISREYFELLCANHAAPPVPVAGSWLATDRSEDAATAEEETDKLVAEAGLPNGSNQ